MAVDNKMFWTVYEKATEKGLLYTQSIIDNQNFGTKLPSQENMDALFSCIAYLEIIKNSVYTYFYIKGLTEISNLLNKI